MTVELCQLVQAGLNDSGGYWWEARLATVEGEVTIAIGEKFIDAGWELNKKEGVLGAMGLGSGLNGFYAAEAETVRRSRAARAKIVASLLAEGWEPFGTNEQGLVVTLRRDKTEQ